MTKDEYDRKLKEVQEIEAQTGVEILKRLEHRAKDGSLAEAGFAHGMFTVFRQTKPFTPETEYFVDESRLRTIIYADFTR